MSNITVVSNKSIKYDGKYHKPGTPIEMDEAVAKVQLEKGNVFTPDSDEGRLAMIALRKKMDYIMKAPDTGKAKENSDKAKATKAKKGK